MERCGRSRRSGKSPGKPVVIAGKGEAGKFVEKGVAGKSFEKGEAGKSVEKEESGKSFDKGEARKSVEKAEAGKSVEKGEAGKSVDKAEAGISVEKAEAGKSVEKGEAGGGKSAEDAGSTKSENRNYCCFCRIFFSDSRRHYASLQHSIMRNMRDEERTTKKGLKKVSRIRRAYKEAIKKARLGENMSSDESHDEKFRRKRTGTRNRQRRERFMFF